MEGVPKTPAVPTAPPEPSPPSNPVSDVLRHALAGIGLSPFVSDDPQFPSGSPALLAVLAWARRKSEDEQSSFGRMFPVGENSDTTGALEPLNQLTDQQLADLAQTMLEDQPTNNTKGTGAGLTFFGQFIDHDLTLDHEPQPSDTVDIDGLVNERTFAFDLDSVYGAA